MAEGTPMMLQYHKIKADHPDCILFFRLGDFYEMFNEDAKVASKELELTLTSRDRKLPPEERTPMCGVPYHAAEAYIARLINKGYKVAICEQMEDPAQAKGLVERDIIRIVTPGTVMEETMLEEGKNNFLCALCLTGERAGLCFADLSTGEVSATGFDGPGWREHVENELGRFSPREVVLSAEAREDKALAEFLLSRLGCRMEGGLPGSFDPDRAGAAAEKQFGANHGLPEGPVVRAAGALMAYLIETQKTDLSHLSAVNYYTTGEFMELDLAARRNLELTETLRGGEKRGSLLWVLDKTCTPMGHRLIRSWLERPLLSPVQIGKRQGAVADLVNDSVTRQELSHELREVTDLERLIGRVVYGTAGGRDLVALSRGLGKLPALRLLLSPFSSALLEVLRDSLDDLSQLRGQIDAAFVDEPPFSVREGGFIRSGYDQEVDRLRGILTGGKDMVAAMEAQEKEKTGIKSLKVSYNKVFGYYIEVSKTNAALVPDTYIRKQTLVNCERYITPELKEMENTILSAQDQLTTLEYQIFCQVRQAAAERVADIQRSAAAVGQVDVLCSFARVAAENGYCMPAVDLGDCVEISEGRHPVVEKTAKEHLFVPNDTKMDGKEDMVAIITGPNMAGKSTYMRQVALIVLMAQMGSFVPAKSAHIGIVDRVFTRIGASDDLSAGQSTFMVEMTEVAELLKNATAKSLLILDEIGRGTSTYDGMAIARAVLEHCADRKRLGCKTLFATHYHELTVLEGQISGVKNYNIAAKKKQDDIIFLRKIVRGGAEASYGIEVAKLAGVPQRVMSRALVIREELETDGAAAGTGSRTMAAGSEQVSLEDMGALVVADRLRAVDVDTLTPIEAMNLVYQLKREL